MNLEDQINEAITQQLSVLYSTDSIKETFGEEVYKAINDIACYATNDMIWASDDVQMSHNETQDRLSAKYPYLTRASKIRIADVAAYFWKSDD
jgi:hypothetical protein